MSYCFNPLCAFPHNPCGSDRCSTCGSGLRLQDRYRALRPLGHGNFGRTFLAVDEGHPDRPRCVIKQSLIASSHSAAAADPISDLFQQEAARLDQLGQHAQIPALLAYVEQEGVHYLVQEFIEGANLEQELAQVGPFAPHQIHQLLQSLLPVLHFIHGRQVIHRDIKPANIIWRPQRQQWALVDFGAARQVTGTAWGRTGTLIGTAEYTAPEQLRGKATYASDLYSLGVTCLHLLTQLSPFDLYDVGEDDWIWRQFLGEQRIPEGLGQVLDGLIQNATRRRFDSAYGALRRLNPLQARLLQLSSGADPKQFQLQAFLQAPRSSGLQLHPRAALVRPERRWICRYTWVAHQGAITALAVHPHQDLILSADRQGWIRLWGVEAGQEMGRWQVPGDGILSLAFSPQGDLWVSGDREGGVQLWHLESGQQVQGWAVENRRVNGVVFSPDQTRLLIGGYDHSLQCWDLGRGVLERRWSAHGGPVRSLRFSPEGGLLVSGGEDALIRLWDWPSLTQVLEIAAFYPVFALDISPDGLQIAAGGYDNSVKVWDLSTGKLQAIYTDHANWVRAVRYSPDGSVLASGGEDYTLKLRDPRRRVLLANFSDHSGQIRHVTFNGRGDRMVSACTDGVIKIWEAVG